MKRKLFLVLAGITLVGGIAALCFSLRYDRVTEASWRQIRLGMSIEEVEQVMGGPGINKGLMEVLRQRNHAGEHFDLSGSGNSIFEFDPKQAIIRHVTWSGRHGFVIVWLGERDIVAGKVFQGTQERSFFSRVRDLLGL
jgi:hypothetical protein